MTLDTKRLAEILFNAGVTSEEWNDYVYNYTFGSNKKPVFVYLLEFEGQEVDENNAD